MPHKVVRGAVFTLESRAAFIEDYQRLGMHLNIWGWEVTTTRITAALVALVVRKSALCRRSHPCLVDLEAGGGRSPWCTTCRCRRSSWWPSYLFCGRYLARTREQ